MLGLDAFNAVSSEAIDKVRLCQGCFRAKEPHFAQTTVLDCCGRAVSDVQGANAGVARLDCSMRDVPRVGGDCQNVAPTSSNDLVNTTHQVLDGPIPVSSVKHATVFVTVHRHHGDIRVRLDHMSLLDVGVELIVDAVVVVDPTLEGNASEKAKARELCHFELGASVSEVTSWARKHKKDTTAQHSCKNKQEGTESTQKKGGM